MEQLDVTSPDTLAQPLRGSDAGLPSPEAHDHTAPASAVTASNRDAPTPTSAPDYPPPLSLAGENEFVWDEAAAPVKNYMELGRRLAQAGDIFRAPQYGGGLMLASPHANVPAKHIKDGKQLAAILLDRVPLRVEKDGKNKGGLLSPRHLQTMLACEAFLQQFSAIDGITDTPQYLANFELTKPGYNDGGPGQRILHTGPKAPIESSLDAINAFLNVMDFETNADRTNAVAAALTVMLRNHWPGAKPVIIATSTKSHGGKDTVIQFACGTAPHLSISYQATDWALERSFVGGVKHNPQTGLVIVENARTGKGARVIASAFLERLITDPEPFFFSTGTGDPVRHKNKLVIAISTNYGTVSTDLMNRALPIRLSPVGDVADRISPIGNPKLEYLPANRLRIEAQLRHDREVEGGRKAGRLGNHPSLQRLGAYHRRCPHSKRFQGLSRELHPAADRRRPGPPGTRPAGRGGLWPARQARRMEAACYMGRVGRQARPSQGAHS